MIEHQRAAEMELLGCVLHNQAILDAVRQKVSVEDFEADAHRRVWDAALWLHDAGKQVDAVNVAEVLYQRQQSPDVPYTYLGELYETVVTAGSAISLAEVVHEHGRNRRYRLALHRLLADAEKHAAPTAELIEDAEREIFGLAETSRRGQVVSLAAGIAQAYEWIDRCALSRGHITGIPTGYPSLDEYLGGLQNSELILLAARPSKGKTSLGLNIARNAAVLHSVAVAFFSLEQRLLELSLRLLSAEASVELQHLRRGRISNDEFSRLPEKGNALRQARIYFDDTPGQTMPGIAATARRLRRQEAIGLVVIDYVALIESEERRASRYDRVSDTSNRLKRLARDLDVPVLALAQLNRESEKRGDPRPKLSDLRDSGNLEQDADTVLLLHEPEECPGVVEVIVAKQRNGPTGEVRLTFHKAFTRFEEYVPCSPAFGSARGLTGKGPDRTGNDVN
jgi:replicative DNA helicase